MRLAMRKVSTRVLPLPAPARINKGPVNVSTASACRAFSWSENFFKMDITSPPVKRRIKNYSEYLARKWCILTRFVIYPCTQVRKMNAQVDSAPPGAHRLQPVKGWRWGYQISAPMAWRQRQVRAA